MSTEEKILFIKAKQYMPLSFNKFMLSIVIPPIANIGTSYFLTAILSICIELECDSRDF